MEIFKKKSTYIELAIFILIIFTTHNFLNNKHLEGKIDHHIKHLKENSDLKSEHLKDNINQVDKKVDEFKKDTQKNFEKIEKKLFI